MGCLVADERLTHLPREDRSLSASFLLRLIQKLLLHASVSCCINRGTQRFWSVEGRPMKHKPMRENIQPITPLTPI